jgi:hypothetical protein
MASPGEPTKSVVADGQTQFGVGTAIAHKGPLPGRSEVDRDDPGKRHHQDCEAGDQEVPEPGERPAR